jgi:hypothetical protein
MSVCPVCSQRSGKRFCPAKTEKICAVCCGSKREIEIDCPSHCTYLRAGWNYEAEKREPDADLASKINQFDDNFIHHMSPVLDELSREVVAERLQSNWLVDNDLIEVYKALIATMKTLSSGIYYESVPTGMVRESLYRRLKAKLDEMMQPQDVDQESLKISEAVAALEFLALAAQMNSSKRPKSRRYLDWLSSMAGASVPQETSSGLILP